LSNLYQLSSPSVLGSTGVQYFIIADSVQSSARCHTLTSESSPLKGVSHVARYTDVWSGQLWMTGRPSLVSLLGLARQKEPQVAVQESQKGSNTGFSGHSMALLSISTRKPVTLLVALQFTSCVCVCGGGGVGVRITVCEWNQRLYSGDTL
jgi:hypothetical protein